MRKTALSTTVRSRKTLKSSMGTVSKSNLKAPDIAECGRTTVKMERDVSFILMETSMMASGKKARPLATASISAVITLPNTKASGSTTIGRTLVSTSVLMDRLTQAR